MSTARSLPGFAMRFACDIIVLRTVTSNRKQVKKMRRVAAFVTKIHRYLLPPCPPIPHSKQTPQSPPFTTVQRPVLRWRASLAEAGIGGAKTARPSRLNLRRARSNGRAPSARPSCTPSLRASARSTFAASAFAMRFAMRAS